MIFLSQFPFILLILCAIWTKIKPAEQSRTLALLEDNNNFMDTYFPFKNILLPWLWLCLWTLLMLNTYRFWTDIKNFNRMPDFLRHDSVLMHSMINSRLPRFNLVRTPHYGGRRLSGHRGGRKMYRRRISKG